MLKLTMSFDMRAPEVGAEPVKLYQAALDQCEWADTLGFETISLMEHHATTDGYLPSPIVMAAAIAGRTKRVKIEISVMILTLYDPIRAAEDLAVLDLASNGRLRLVVGAGYRPEEFTQFGLNMKKRPSLMERGIDTLKKAWTGQPFEFEGRTVRILPRPAQKPRPEIIMGGSSKAAAERAARIADGFHGSPDLNETYAKALAALGKPVPTDTRLPMRYFLLYVSKNPDEAWRKVGANVMHVNNEYARWQKGNDSAVFFEVTNIEELKKSWVCNVVTPQECVEMARRDGGLTIQPLFAGLDPALAWESLHLVEKEVLPQLRAGQ
jgi:alkanesulfonate monooxygenase SsuD/methylene tetrahydromethanopterin reductase-like flavin-dependent oxidoreductase (luciferase family)